MLCLPLGWRLIKLKVDAITKFFRFVLYISFLPPVFRRDKSVLNIESKGWLLSVVLTLSRKRNIANNEQRTSISKQSLVMLLHQGGA